MKQQKHKKPWGGRFKTELNPTVQRYTRSLHLDRRLAGYDIEGSREHVRMLAKQGILSTQDEASILKGLEKISQEIESDQFPYREELEDIHMNVEVRLSEVAGEAGGRIHTGRSRNDQVALDLKLFCLETSRLWRNLILDNQRELVSRSEDLKEDLFPGWTHLQAAQPLAWGHYLLAYCEMLSRDFRRLESYEQLHDVCPLGAGALAGSTMHLEPQQTAGALGFSSSFGNSYDVVGDRDFVLELLQIACQVMLHVSRFSEDYIYFSSTPVGWIDLPDNLCTGSSMMPQKKNPDLLELARGKCASVLGHVTGMATLLKGIPSSYHRDLQQDKEHLFPAVDTVSETLEIIPLVIRGFRVNKQRTRKALDQGFLMATDLAEYLIGKGVAFRDAHEKVGRLVAYCLEHGETIEELPMDVIRKFAPECDVDVAGVLDPIATLSRRTHRGSTGLSSVEGQLADWKEWIEAKR